MSEPENHTRHLLREIRKDIRKLEQELRGDIQELDQKVDAIHADLGSRIDGPMRTLACEMADRVHAAGRAEHRLRGIVRRPLEQDRKDRP